MKRAMIFMLVLSFSVPTMAKSYKRKRKVRRNHASTKSVTTAKKQTAKSAINNSWQVEVGMDQVTSTNTTPVTHSNLQATQGRTNAISRDGSRNLLKLSVRKNFSLGNNFFANIGSSIKQQSTKSESATINNATLSVDPSSFTIQSQIRELLVEQRVGKLFNTSLLGKSFGLRPFTGVAAGFRETTVDYSTTSTYFGGGLTSQGQTTSFVLVPTIGTDIIITNSISASLTLSQTNIKTKGAQVRQSSGNVVSFGSANDSASILSLGVSYNF